ncbi:hypothetical protein AYI68_g3863 [Smittium mucronatum]|uniref:Uncharacterized protein n=1 Tax=Smittium mucronatum TaxID=133383 RepID=A0A1R0GYU8_9FUNG|nr:hypothetical protein AYI68_g3863 [Smittium mucronatum]
MRSVFQGKGYLKQLLSFEIVVFHSLFFLKDAFMLIDWYFSRFIVLGLVFQGNLQSFSAPHYLPLPLHIH